jgi:hypothetical protein
MTLHIWIPENEEPPCKKAVVAIGRPAPNPFPNSVAVSAFLPTAEAASRVAPSAARRGIPHRFSGVEDPGMAALHKDQLRASVLLDRLRAAKARLVEGHPAIELQFGDIASARECFAMILPE